MSEYFKIGRLYQNTRIGCSDFSLLITGNRSCQEKPTHFVVVEEKPIHFADVEVVDCLYGDGHMGIAVPLFTWFWREVG